jgi:sulfate transport system ATP-binding protein
MSLARLDDTPAPTTVTLEDVRKSFARYPALNGVSLDIAAGELIALLGPSGSGKTTLLRIIAGLEFPDQGRVSFGDQDVTFAHAAQRGVGFVFQQYALFKHMTVARNITFGLDVKPGRDKPSAAARKARCEELLDLVELSGLGGRFPSQLSGGQRQRVALARALAVSPRILLLDEPFGALDATVRKTLRRELRRLHDATGLTTVFVTHDQEEALDLADRVALLNGGRIEQVGAPREILDHPASAFVAGFVGEANALKGTARGGVFTLGGATLAAAGVADGPATAFIRPEQFAIAAPGEDGLDIRLDRATQRGPLVWLEGATFDGQPVEAAVLAEGVGALTPGATVRLAMRGARVFAAN